MVGADPVQPDVERMKRMRGLTNMEKVSIRSSGSTQAMPIWQMLAASLQAVSTSIAMNRKRPEGMLSAWPKRDLSGAGAGIGASRLRSGRGSGCLGKGRSNNQLNIDMETPFLKTRHHKADAK